MRRGWVVLLLVFVTASASGAEPVAALRRPVAIAASGDRLIVANRRSGTVSVVDLRTARVTDETRVGRTLSDLVVSADGHDALVTDESAGELIRLSWDGSHAPAVQSRLSLSAYPVSVRVSR